MSKFQVQAAYDRALYASRAAATKFRKVQELYRARQITDAAFLQEQREHSAAVAAFDKVDVDFQVLLAYEEAIAGLP